MTDKSKGWGTGELIPTDAGFSWRVRLGSAGRKTFKLRDGLSPAEAEDRQAVLAEMKARLKRAKAPIDRVGRFLEQAADADAATLEVILQVVDKQCGGKLVERASKSTTPTFREVAELWTSGELAKRYPDRVVTKRSADSDAVRLGRHIYTHPMANKPIDRVTEADCEAVLDRVDPNLAHNTRRQIAQLMIRVLNLACYPLKLIAHSPLRKGFLPTTGKRKAMNYLYVDEDRRLMAETSIPLSARLLWGFLAREGMRFGEVIALNWSDVDLTRGTLRLDHNKTDTPRAWALNPGVVRALRSWRDLTDEDTGPADPVFVDPHGRRLTEHSRARALRSHLAAIGLDKERPELFERSAVRQPMRVHDLRATFITISLAIGKSETWVSDRTGHESSDMIHNYKRAARSLAEINQGELTPLDEAIPELRSANLGGDLAAGLADMARSASNQAELGSSRDQDCVKKRFVYESSRRAHLNRLAGARIDHRSTWM